MYAHAPSYKNWFGIGLDSLGEFKYIRAISKVSVIVARSKFVYTPSSRIEIAVSNGRDNLESILMILGVREAMGDDSYLTSKAFT